MKRRITITRLGLFIIYTAIIFGSGISPIPKIIYPVGMFLGLFTFYAYFYLLSKGTKWLDGGLFLLSILGSATGSFFVWITCNLINGPVCQASPLSAQVFGNFAFPLLILFWLWVIYRLPILLRRKK